MTRLFTILTSALLCMNLPLAYAEEKGQSLMFAPKQPAIDLTSDGTNPSPGDKCEALLREAESLQGKPQRKHTILERYRLECTEAQNQ